MVRRTKAEALATRGRILDAAEHLFHDKGVSRTSLEDIAREAGVTRGAIYWHFPDKATLFNEMMQRVLLPLEEASSHAGQAACGSPLAGVRAYLLGVLRELAHSEHAQRVFNIATHKVEYVGELLALRERHAESRRNFLRLLQRGLRAAQQAGEMPPAPSARIVALGLEALLSGLIHSWMLDERSFDLLTAGRHAIDAHLAGIAHRG